MRASPPDACLSALTSTADGDVGVGVQQLQVFAVCTMPEGAAVHET